jgi:hypothetical protein
MADAVSQRFNINMDTYFPKFSKELREINRWKEQTEYRMQKDQEDTAMDAKKNQEADNKQLTFMVNNCTTEINLVKKMFTVERLKAIDQI